MTTRKLKIVIVSNKIPGGLWITAKGEIKNSRTPTLTSCT